MTSASYIILLCPEPLGSIRMFETPINYYVSLCYFSVDPSTESVHIAVSDNEFRSLNESVRASMRQCSVVKAMIPLEFDMNMICAKDVHGRYVYISLIRESDGPGEMSLYEIQVYMGKY